jgi:hypothetical protein
MDAPLSVTGRCMLPRCNGDCKEKYPFSDGLMFSRHFRTMAQELKGKVTESPPDEREGFFVVAEAT